METNRYIIDFYNHYDEDSRLAPRHGMVEFLTTMRYIERFIRPGDRVLEIGAGTGRYSHALEDQKDQAVDTLDGRIASARRAGVTPAPRTPLQCPFLSCHGQARAAAVLAFMSFVERGGPCLREKGRTPFPVPASGVHAPGLRHHSFPGLDCHREAVTQPSVPSVQCVSDRRCGWNRAQFTDSFCAVGVGTSFWPLDQYGLDQGDIS